MSSPSPSLSWCRHCGRPNEMTDEHVPPKSTGNTGPVRVADPFDGAAVLSEVAAWRDGHVVRTLCRTCNGRASDWGYVREYHKWHDLFVKAHTAGRRTKVDPFRGSPFSATLPYDVMPARFIRQVVGMMLAVQETEDLFAEHPQLAKLIDADPALPTGTRREGVEIEPLHLYLSVYSGPWAYGTRPMAQVEVPLEPGALIVPPGSSSRTTTLWVLALSPFVFIAADSPGDRYGFEITTWARWRFDQRPSKSERGVTLPTVEDLEPGLRAMLQQRITWCATPDPVPCPAHELCDLDLRPSGDETDERGLHPCPLVRAHTRTTAPPVPPDEGHPSQLRLTSPPTGTSGSDPRPIDATWMAGGPCRPRRTPAGRCRPDRIAPRTATKLSGTATGDGARAVRPEPLHGSLLSGVGDGGVNRSWTSVAT